MRKPLTPGLNQRAPKNATDPRKWLLSSARSTQSVLLVVIPLRKDPAHTAPCGGPPIPAQGAPFPGGDGEGDQSPLCDRGRAGQVVMEAATVEEVTLSLPCFNLPILMGAKSDPPSPAACQRPQPPLPTFPLPLQLAEGLCTRWVLCQGRSAQLQCHLPRETSQSTLCKTTDPSRPALPGSVFIAPCTPDILYLFIWCLSPPHWREKSRLCAHSLLAAFPEPRAPWATLRTLHVCRAKELHAWTQTSHSFPSRGSCLKEAGKVKYILPQLVPHLCLFICKLFSTCPTPEPCSPF